MGSGTIGIEVIGRVLMGVEVGGFYGSTLVSGTGGVRAMVYLHWPNISRRYVIA